jgi:hypothetical protein
MEPLLIVNTADDRTLTVARRLDGGLVVHEGDRELAEIRGDVTPFLFDGSIALAGAVDGPEAHSVMIAGPDVLDYCRICDRVWMSFPRPFTPGMQITATWRAEDGRELFRIESPPLHADQLVPMFGPTWTGYARES